MIVVIILFVGLVVAGGFMLSNAARIQHIANLVSLAALERFSQTTPPSGPNAYSQKASQALTRANDIYARNSLPGFRGTFGDILHAPQDGPGGTMTLGNWLREPPPSPTPGCPGSDYPCFISNPPPAPGLEVNANSVKIDLKNNIPFEMPFCSFLNACQTNFRAEAYSTLAQSCVAFVIDLSRSTYFSTHKAFNVSRLTKPPPDLFGPPPVSWDDVAYCVGNGFPWDNIYYCDVSQAANGTWDGTGLALPFYRRGNLDLHPQYQIGTRNCEDSDIPNQDKLHWCNLARQGAPTYSSRRPIAAPIDISKHYMSDYLPRVFVDGLGINHNIMVDSFVDNLNDPPLYEGPEPFTSFFHAINASLRALERQSAAGDKAALRGFTGVIKARFPDDQPYLTNNFGMLTQISNLRNRGTIGVAGNPVDQEIRPNFIDYQFFSLISRQDELEANTNPVLALNDAITILTDECPSSAQRTILLLTDGVSSCRRKAGYPADSLEDSAYECDVQDYQFFVDARSQLLTDILPRLIDEQISVVAVVAGEHVGPNFINLSAPDDGRPLTPAEAHAFGLPWDDMFNTVPAGAPDNATAYGSLGDPGVIFREPVELIAQLAILSGGTYCPLMPLCGGANLPPSGQACTPDCGSGNECYEQDPDNPSGPCKLKDIHRTAGIPQTCSLYRLTEARQAAQCAVDFLSGSRYILTTEERP